jgi:hypothetical protein
MVFPYMSHDLAGLLENPKVNLTMQHAKLYSKQLLEGTCYLHKVLTIPTTLFSYCGAHMVPPLPPRTRFCIEI